MTEKRITEKEILDEIKAYRKEKRMNEEFINEGYLDMLIQQSYSNEEKAGAKADSVASKLEYIKSAILSNNEIVNRLRELPFDLIIQHIRDSFSEDKEYMSNDAITKTVKCIEDLMKLQKILGEKE